MDIIKELLRLSHIGQQQDHPFEVGKSYLFRTVTHIDIGRVVNIRGIFIILEEASWIADTKRYANIFRDGFSDQAEIEPYPDEMNPGLNMTTIIDYAPWDFPLPRRQQ